MLMDALQGGGLDLPYLRMNGKAVAARNFEPSFRLSLAAKDADLIEHAAARHGMDLRLFHVIRWCKCRVPNSMVVGPSGRA